MFEKLEDVWAEIDVLTEGWLAYDNKKIKEAQQDYEESNEWD